MGQGEILGIGILLAGLGGIFWILTHLLLRGIAVSKPGAGSPPEWNDPDLTDSQADAVILILPGGKMGQVNGAARTLFKLSETDSLNLERLARRVRPVEKFLELCSVEGHDRLNLDGRPVDISTYRVSLPPQSVMLVTARLAEPDGEPLTQGAKSGRDSLQWISNLTQLIGSSLDLDTTLRAIQSSLSRVMPADLVEICLWESEAEQLVPYRFIGRSGGDPELETPSERYRLGEGAAGQIARETRGLLVPDLLLRPELRFSAWRGAEALNSLAGVPLLFRDHLVGVMVAGALTREAYSVEEMNLLVTLAAPAAAALNNALRFRDEQRRAVELAGLAQLAQGFSSAREPRALYARLVQSVLPLIDVDILGFLIYNENSRTLEGQEPIFGLPEQFVELYRVPVPPNSPAEQMLLNQDLIITEAAAESSEWEALGLSYLARAASLRDTVLVPLASGGRMLGYLQASNHQDGRQIFTQEEIHLLTIVANQAAPVIENVTLAAQARSRLQRAEALRRIASLASSAATLDEILKFALQELSHMLHADLAFIFLQDGGQGALRLHQESFYGQAQSLPGLTYLLSVDDPQFPFTISGSGHALSTGNINDEQAVIPFYHQLTQAWQVVSAIAVPLVVRDTGIGEIWLCSRQDGAFNQGDVQMAATAAGQLAAVVERSFLSEQTDVRLRRRVEQLTSLTRFSRGLIASRDFPVLLDLILAEARKLSGVDCGTILLLNSVPGAATGPEIRLAAGETHPPQLDAQEIAVLRTGEILHLVDLEQKKVPIPHPGVAAVLTVPIRFQGRAIGLILLHSSNPAGFEADEIEVVQSLAAQAAIALGDALSFEEQQDLESQLERKLALSERLARLAKLVRPDTPIIDILGETARAIRAATPFQIVVISLYEPRLDGLRRVVGIGLGEEAWEELHAHIQPWTEIDALLQPEFQTGSVYFIPALNPPGGSEDDQGIKAMALNGVPAGDAGAWDAADRLLAPFVDDNGQPLGLISLDAPADGRRPDSATIEAVEILMSQAALAIVTDRTANSLERQLARMEGDQLRLQQAADQATAVTPLFLRLNLEQTLAIQNLNSRMERVRSGLEIAEQVNRQPDTLSVLRALARELLARFDMQLGLVAEKNSTGIHLLDILGSITSNANPEALFGQRNPLRQMLQDGQLLLAADLEDSSDWRSSPLLAAVGARSFIALPLEIDADHRGGVMAIGLRALPPFNEEDHQFYGQLSRQASLGAQNLSLLDGTRRRLREMDQLLEFTRKLGILDPKGVLLTLVETVLEVLPNADAGWVGYWLENKMVIPQVARGYADNAAMLSISYQALEDRPAVVLPVRVALAGKPLRADVAFAQDYSLQPGDLLRYRQGTGGRLPVSTMIIPIARGDPILGVLVVDQFSQSSPFGLEDEAFVLSLARQTALALENARLFVSTEMRAAQLQALNQASSILTSALEPGELISTLLEQLRSVLPYETATLWLRQENRLSVAAAHGFSDNESRTGILTAVKDSVLFQEMANTLQPVLVQDVRLDARFPNLLTPENLSWFGVPLITKGELTGVIALEKKEPGFYTPDHVQSASTFAGQAAVALENARLFEERTRRAAELDQRSQRLVLLNRLSSELGASLDEDTILGVTCQQLHDALNAGWVSAFLIGERETLELKAEFPARENQEPVTLSMAPLLERLSESQGIFSAADIQSVTDLNPLGADFLIPRGVQSVVLVPLVTAVGLRGWLAVQNREPYRFTPAEIELARTISNQAAVALQNAQLYEETRRLTRDLEKRVEERTRDVRREHNNTQALLRILTELSSSLDLDLVMNRTLIVLNEAIGAEQSVILLNNGKTYQAGVELLRRSEKASLPKESIAWEISRWVSRRRVPALVDQVLEDARWKVTSGDEPEFHSVIAVPLILGEEVLGSLLLLQRQPSAFMLEQVSLVEATARQFSVSLNNAELFTLIRDQAENLGGLLREQQIESSRSRAILESVADGVIVTNASIQVQLFNAAAGNILGLKPAEVQGKSLQPIADLFGGAGPVWLETIRRWSQESKASPSGETYAEQVNLESGRIVAVNMAPVFYRDRFLATVSILRDITQDIQVDRLKTEFVANVSHELRTPMTSIKGYVEILLMGVAGELNEQQRRFLAIIQDNTQRLHGLVNELLDVSKIEAGRVVLSLQPLDLAAIATEVLREVRQRSHEENKPITIDLEAPEGLPRVLGDAMRVRQVLASLVNNSYNYTQEEGRVLVRIQEKEGEVQVDVQDTGIGIEVDDQPRVFERFFRGGDPLVLATAGAGLGLAISKILIEMHHGRIWFHSSGVRGEGSVFSIALPVIKGEV